MNWRHRVWQCSNEHETWLAVKETYYNDSGEICGCTEGVAVVQADDLKNLSDYLQFMTNAVNNVIDGYEKILVEKDFKFANWDD